MNFLKKPVKEISSFDEFVKFAFYMFIFYCLTHTRCKQKLKKTIKKTIKNSIIGLESVKEEINYYMDFIKNKIKYQDWGVKLPKGILLAGPPGTGKTLLVKSMAKDLDLPIISASGSEFVEKYVGVGASRIRKLFKKAKKHEKGAIIFIDEIDAIGMNRETRKKF